MSPQALTSPYPPVRRVVTGHDPSGKSVFLADSVVPEHTFSENADALFTGLYRHDEFPASNQDSVAGGEEGQVPEKKTTTTTTFDDLIAAHPRELVSKGGTTFWAVDTAPRSKSPFHRTLSLDYGIVAKGTITLVLDGGERVQLSAGDVIVQRGTIHEWINESDEWTRVFFVVISSKKVKIGEEELDTEFR